MQANGENNCFISLKDHKENLQNNPTVRLINPAKNKLGKISKVIFDKINKNIENLQLNGKIQILSSMGLLKSKKNTYIVL